MTAGIATIRRITKETTAPLPADWHAGYLLIITLGEATSRVVQRRKEESCFAFSVDTYVSTRLKPDRGANHQKCHRF